MGSILRHHFCKDPLTLLRQNAHKVTVIFLLKSPFVSRWIQNCEIVFQTRAEFCPFRSELTHLSHGLTFIIIAKKNKDFYCSITLDSDVLVIRCMKTLETLEHKRLYFMSGKEIRNLFFHSNSHTGFCVNFGQYSVRNICSYFVTHTVPVSKIYVFSNKCSSWYNIRNTYKHRYLFHISANRCHIQGVTTAKVYEPVMICSQL
jgi:hypothetical protein